MFKPKTYLEFCQVMQLQTVVEINSKPVIVKGISIEDGSGRNFNLEVQPVTFMNGGVPYQIEKTVKMFVSTQ